VLTDNRSGLCAVLFKSKIENMKKNNIQKMPKAGQAGNGTKPPVSGSAVNRAAELLDEIETQIIVDKNVKLFNELRRSKRLGIVSPNK
jgi:hypothetical protein